MARVYIAARYSRRLEMVDRRAELLAAGHVSTATWLDGAHEALDPAVNGAKQYDPQWAADDLMDIRASDWFVMFADPLGTVASGGRHVELGYALALNHEDVADGIGLPLWPIQVAIVGDPENVFHALPDVLVFESWARCLAALEASVLGPAR